MMVASQLPPMRAELSSFWPHSSMLPSKDFRIQALTVSVSRLTPKFFSCGATTWLNLSSRPGHWVRSCGSTVVTMGTSSSASAETASIASRMVRVAASARGTRRRSRMRTIGHSR